MSGVQVDHSPAVATRSLDISSWKDADVSELNSSEKKRYYRRKSAIKEYFTTEESLAQIASRYHLPVKMLEKLARRCTMQHEDGTIWGYRALVPGTVVTDHKPAPMSSNGATPASGAGAHNDEEAHRLTESHDDGAAGNHNAAIHAPDTADAKTHDDNDTKPTTAVDNDGQLGAINQASPEGEADTINQSDVEDEEDAIKRVSTEPESSTGADSVGTRLIASSPSASALSPVSESTFTLEDTSDNDPEDTAPRQAIVLPQQSPEPTDEMPDIIGIEETNLENRAEDSAEVRKVGEPLALAKGEEGDTTIDAEGDTLKRLPSEPTLPNDAVGTRFIASALIASSPSPVSESASPSEPVLQPDSTSEQPAEPIIAQSTVDTLNRKAEPHTPLPDISRGDSGEFYMPELSTNASRSLVVYERMLPAALPRTSKKQVAIPGIDKKAVVTRRSIRKRWGRSVELTRKRKTHRLIGGVVVAVLLLSLLIPVGAGLAAYSAYNSIKGIALDGVNHLLDLKTLLPASKSDLTAVLNPAKLQQASSDFTQAQSDFLQLQQLVNRPDIQSLVQQFAPQYSNKLGMAQRLVQVGIDVTRMGSELIGIADLGANILHGSPLASGSTKPLITVSDVSNIEGTMLHALYYIQDIKTQMSQVSLNQLPISAKQQQEITSAMAMLPKAQSYIEQGQGMIGMVSWLLGVGHARRFLVQTMDHAELRPSGGFTGQYGVITIQDGRMSPFTLQDVTELDYNGNGQELGRQAPPEYASWMNFGNFGLRDANLSGDFPTSARIAMQVFQDEGGGPVDGDIMFTPTAIAHVLDIIGPLKIPTYNETITAQNLEDKIHYYQNDSSAIYLQQQKTGTHNAATRKSFTALVGSTLLSTVRHLPIKTLLKVAQNATKDIQSRDLEIYFNNSQAEGWLLSHSFSGAMNTFSNIDGFMVVQSNISISKASDDVQTTEQDNIVLDAQGGATHNLTITLDYEGTKPIYSVYTTYADYIRVYAPADAVLQSGSGFDTGKALCTPTPVNPTGTGKGPVNPPSPNPGGTPPCSKFTQSYSSNALSCPGGNYNLGPRGWSESKGYSNWSIDELGGPTELTSDLPGRAMWGGLTVTPKNCILTITLSWYVPNVIKHVAGQPLYSVLVQKQGGYIPIVQITIDTSQLKGVKPYSFNGNIYADRIFSLPVVKKGH